MKKGINPMTLMTVLALSQMEDWLRLPTDKGSAFADIASGKKKSKEVVSGRIVEVKPKSLVGRNDPCSCGSGKKFKKCCY